MVTARKMKYIFLVSSLGGVMQGAVNTQVPTLIVKSSAFEHDKEIPQVYTCEGAGNSFQISWSKNPEGTKSLVVIMDDPDAPLNPPFVHWVIFNLPPSVQELPEKVVFATHEPAKGALEGTNSAGRTRYVGPCPPTPNHHYHVKVYALSTTLNLNSSAQKSDVERAMSGHILAQGELIGTYTKKNP